MAQEDKLFIDKLEGVKNWQVWKYQMQVILKARELWGYIDGTVTSPALLESSSSRSSAQRAFEMAQKKTKALLVRQKFFSLKMKDCDSLDDYLRRMKEITDQLAAIKAPIPEDEHIVALLLSLPRSYKTLTTALTAKGNDLSLTQVHQALMSEEEKRGLYKGKDGGGRVDKGETALQHEKTSRKPIKCFGCGEENHVIRNCPKR
ncbi:Retrovirus-related Pol poly from transposon TNT 1-94 [Paramuricea clavata]|uniref:Retrovirus-related Pol poly from transposon TNT 1-94 n=1 Tax=Paramuricea clavata TaxID=317549 RepID=A0A6S7ID37_PARCT|nr:Retrovirus-related Pol poly from transposon TNT 1-94 [Paramuricea clavata]